MKERLLNAYGGAVVRTMDALEVLAGKNEPARFAVAIFGLAAGAPLVAIGFAAGLKHRWDRGYW